MYKICLDYGHGGSDPGAVYKGRKESDDNLNIGVEVAKELRRHGVKVGETRTSNATVSLNDRSRFENRNTYDYFISFHRNAFQPEKAKGVETFTYLNAGAKSKGLAHKIQDGLVELGFVNRGVKQANFHVLRETKAPAILIEIGFIDSSGDNSLFDSKRNEIIRSITKAILAQIGLIYIEPSSTTQPIGKQSYYRVMAGSFKVKENAENQVQKLKKAGFKDAYIKYE